MQKKKKQNINPYFIAYIKVNAKWIIRLNVKPKTVKFIEKKTGKNPCDLGLDEDFLDIMSKAQSIKGNVELH